MAKKCDICGRSATKGASRSHSKIKTLRRQHINLQAKNIDGLKIKVCTSCLRTRAKKEREIEEKISTAKSKAQASKPSPKAKERKKVAPKTKSKTSKTKATSKK